MEPEKAMMSDQWIAKNIALISTKSTGQNTKKINTSMNPKTALAISAGFILSACTYAPNNSKTINNYSASSVPVMPATPVAKKQKWGMYTHEQDIEMLARIAVVQDLEDVNKRLDAAIAQLK